MKRLRAAVAISARTFCFGLALRMQIRQVKAAQQRFLHDQCSLSRGTPLSQSPDAP